MNTDRPEVINGIETGRDNNRLTPKWPRLMLNVYYMNFRHKNG